MYAQAQAESPTGSEAPGAESSEGSGGDEDVIDAEIVDDEGEQK